MADKKEEVNKQPSGKPIAVKVNPDKNSDPRTAYTLRWEGKNGPEVATVRNCDTPIKQTDLEKGVVVKTFEPVKVPSDHAALLELMAAQLVIEAR